MVTTLEAELPEASLVGGTPSWTLLGAAPATGKFSSSRSVICPKPMRALVTSEQTFAEFYSSIPSVDAGWYPILSYSHPSVMVEGPPLTLNSAAAVDTGVGSRHSDGTASREWITWEAHPSHPPFDFASDAPGDPDDPAHQPALPGQVLCDFQWTPNPNGSFSLQIMPYYDFRNGNSVWAHTRQIPLPT